MQTHCRALYSMLSPCTTVPIYSSAAHPVQFHCLPFQCFSLPSPRLFLLLFAVAFRLLSPPRHSLANHSMLNHTIPFRSVAQLVHANAALSHSILSHCKSDLCCAVPFACCALPICSMLFLRAAVTYNQSCTIPFLSFAVLCLSIARLLLA